MPTSDKSPSRKETAPAFHWKQGQTFERPAILYSDGSFGTDGETCTAEELRARLPEENVHETDPAHLARVGRLRVEVLAVEDPPETPPLPSTDVVDLLQRVRALPRLTPSLKAEIDLVLSGAAHG